MPAYSLTIRRKATRELTRLGFVTADTERDAQAECERRATAEVPDFNKATYWVRAKDQSHNQRPRPGRREDFEDY